MSEKKQIILIGPILSFNRMMKLITLLVSNGYLQEMTVGKLFKNFVVTCGDEVLMSTSINTMTVEDRGTKAYQELKEDLERYFLGSMRMDIRDMPEENPEETEEETDGKPEDERAGDDLAEKHGGRPEQPGRNQRGAVPEPDPGTERPARKARRAVSAGQKQPGQSAERKKANSGKH